MTAPSIDTGHGSSADADTHRATVHPVVGYPEWLNGTPEMPVGTPDWCTLATDKIEGLTEDLLQAVSVAYRRGATEWTRRNYPLWHPWIASQQAAVSPAEQVGRSEATAPNPIVPDLLEALRPFARLADMVGDAWTDDTAAFIGHDVAITIGQLRKAREALSRAETPTCGGDR